MRSSLPAVARRAKAGLAGGGRFRLQSAQQRRPDTAVAVLGQQRDVHDAELVVSPVQVETTGRLPADENDVERRALVVLLVVGCGASNCIWTNAAFCAASHSTTLASSGSRVLADTDRRNVRSSGRTERSAIAALSSSCVTVPAVSLSAGRRPAARCRSRTSGTAVRLSWLVAARRRSTSRPLA